MKKPYTKHASKIVYQTPWIKIREDNVTLPNGQPGTYSYLESKDSVMIATLDEHNRIYLVKAFRYPSKTWGWELPGGGGDGEEIINASKRELLEETGITAENWKIIGQAYVCNGLMTERMAVAVARDLSIGQLAASDEEVFDGSGFFAPNEIDHMIETGEVNDCQTLAALHLVEKNLRKL